ncbi:glycoside hydrolase family 15 [Occultella kanbiaonis]|uniref:glycoside hydrolase family 15 n=1 Tax=Occultella kanbiaonis TaxID=2675754 RepID=UPI0012B98823|nr:glycoside hydrolase family 15 [Occultella kanbiaonis]
MSSRRRRFWTLAAVVAVVALVGAAAAVRDRGRVDEVGLYTLGIGVQADGSVTTIPTDSDARYLPGTRVIDPGPDASDADREAAEALAEATRTWLDAGTVPGVGGPHEELVTDALLDLHTLTLEGGAAVAGFSSKWRYVWPRDASFVAAALTVTGHHEDAVEVFTFLDGVQHPDGSFEARYLPDGSGPPDARGLQTDGTGWVLWALAYAADVLGPGAERDELLATFAPMIERSTGYLRAQVANPRSLPAPSADYWEHRESTLTLGTAAPVLAGLEASARLHSWLGRDSDAAAVGADADRLEQAVVANFGQTGYGRYAGRSPRDAATAFVLPPFQPEALPGAAAAWESSIAEMNRPAGGLAPGGSWPETSISWTPQTSLYAWSAAANGETARADGWLTWITQHRTPLGAIPEKVGPDGSPAGVAPLMWSAAVVILTVAELEGNAP